MPQKPNILYLHSHDTGRYIQPYGHAVPTPALQRFAEQGLLFRNAFCANPTCSPARACLLTGSYAHQNGMLGLAHLGWELTDTHQHMAWTLAAAGYQTVLSGTSHVTGHFDQRKELLGYQRILHDEGEPGRSFDCYAADFLAEAHDQPWFMACGFNETHRPFPEEPAENPDFTLPPPCLPDTPDTRLDMARYKASAAILDQKMGHVLQALDDSGQADNTLVILTTDHGLAFPHMKCHLYDHGIGVMLILRGPGGFSGGRATDAIVSHVDIFPTVCDVAGIERPDWLVGKSLLPLADAPASQVRQAVYADVNFHVSYDPQRCIRTTRYKYIRRFDDRSRAVLPNTDDSLSKSHWLEVGYPGVSAEEFYDLAYDPQEACNRIDDPAYAGVIDDLKSRLHDWMLETDDPLLDGPIEPPPTAKLVPPDGKSPDELTI